MNQRTLIAAVLGGLTVFLWGFVSHMLLPLGEIGFRHDANEDAVLATMKAGLPGTGVYYLPGLAGEKMNDEAAVKAYSAKALANPGAFIVYQTEGKDGMDMGGNLAMEFASNVVAAMLLAVLMGLVEARHRFMLALAVGVFAWLTVNVPYLNWYRFPLDFTLAALAQIVIGWALAGLVMGWWLGRAR